MAAKGFESLIECEQTTNSINDSKLILYAMCNLSDVQLSQEQKVRYFQSLPWARAAIVLCLKFMFESSIVECFAFHYAAVFCLVTLSRNLAQVKLIWGWAWGEACEMATAESV